MTNAGVITIRCIHCNEETVNQDIIGVETDLCPNCAGLWLDGGELKAITQYNVTVGRVLKCMRCDDSNMKAKLIKGVEVDVCPQCNGMFLDRGEMEKLSAIESHAGNETDIGEFPHNANKARLNIAIKNFKTGKMNKGKATQKKSTLSGVY